MAERNATLPPDRRIEFRIGINVGDIVVEDGDIFGDGVNVAARLEGLAEPGGICVSARVQEDAAGRLDLAFEDMGEQALKNIARPVRVYRVRLTRSRDSRTKAAADLPALPFPTSRRSRCCRSPNMSGDPEQEYFADGMVEEIITALSRIRWLFVIARNSSFTYKGQAVDVKQVGRELGVRYVLEGSVRKAGGRVRITAQLIDATDRRASLGRPLRRLARRRLRPSGQGGDRASPASSSRHCRPPKPRARPTARRTISPPTTSICAPMRWSCRRHAQVPEALRSARAGDRARSALRAGARLGGDLLLSASS